MCSRKRAKRSPCGVSGLKIVTLATCMGVSGVSI
jgi:hypothetical protein